MISLKYAILAKICNPGSQISKADLWKTIIWSSHVFSEEHFGTILLDVNSVFKYFRDIELTYTVMISVTYTWAIWNRSLQRNGNPSWRQGLLYFIKEHRTQTGGILDYSSMLNGNWQFKFMGQTWHVSVVSFSHSVGEEEAAEDLLPLARGSQKF